MFIRLCVLTALIFTLANTARAENRWQYRLGFTPLSGLFSRNLEGFTVSHPNYATERCQDNESWLISGTGEVSLSTGPLSYDLSLSYGHLYNSAFTGSISGLDLGITWKQSVTNDGHTSRLALRPYIGLVRASELEWEQRSGPLNGTPDLTFAASTGFRTGLLFTAGNHWGGLRLDLAIMEIPDSTIKEINPGWDTNQNSINLSGWSIQAGFHMNF